MTSILVITGFAFLVLGLLCLVRSKVVSESVQRFYSNYPLIQYAGENQLRIHSLYILMLGIVFFILGCLAVLQILYR